MPPNLLYIVTNFDLNFEEFIIIIAIIIIKNMSDIILNIDLNIKELIVIIAIRTV